jgi:pSer/pThr/pTyr-binding forkhead associated (FHA) protein
MAYVFCNRCGHRNPPESGFCSACGSALDNVTDRTVTLAKIDPLLDSISHDDDVQVDLGAIPSDSGVLIVRNGARAGEQFTLHSAITRLGRHPESDIVLDDITVSRRHVEVEHLGHSYKVRDVGSLNGTYVNQVRIDDTVLRQGDELQVGKFRLVFFERAQ